VGGAGLSGAARLLVANGHRVTGHDRLSSDFTRSLREIGLEVVLGKSRTESLPDDVQLVARSAALDEDDPQLVEARRRGLSVIKYSELLGLICPAGRTLATAGTHGKTTVSWMIYHALAGLTEALTTVAKMPGRDTRSEICAGPEIVPGALIGGNCRLLGLNATAPGTAGWFAVEACEYDRSFLHLAPRGAAITNVEEDHLDYYGSLAAIEKAFGRFTSALPTDGLLVIGRQVPEVITDAAPCPVWQLGRELRVELLGQQLGRFRFRLLGPGWATPPISLHLPGAFQVDNAAVALGLVLGLAAPEMGLEPTLAAEACARALARFRGVARRFEPWGTSGGIEVIHDYAHHPTEVRVVVEAARRALPGKPLHVLFQPHQHSRTARFMDAFVESLRGVDRVIVADVYGARTSIDDVAAGSPELVTRLLRAGVDAVEGGPPAASSAVLAQGLPPESAALVLGAGDIDGIKDELLHDLALRGAPRG
jgi:UDP-N-acetylmuramate--alanine ligase